MGSRSNRPRASVAYVRACLDLARSRSDVATHGDAGGPLSLDYGSSAIEVTRTASGAVNVPSTFTRFRLKFKRLPEGR